MSRSFTNLGSRPSMRVPTAIVLWIISEMAVAGPLEEANSAYDKGDFGLAP